MMTSLTDRRQTILQVLHEDQTGVSSVADLTEAVVEREGLDESVAERVEIALYHVDLPKLADTGVLEFDPRSKTVRYRESMAVGEVLEALEPPEEMD